MDETSGPVAESRAAEERRLAGEIARSAHVLAELAIVVAADHMAALERELMEPVMTFAPWTTARGILESSATAMWLTDDIDVQTRIARSLNLRLRHLKDQRIYARDARKRHPNMESFGEAIHGIEERIEHLIRLANHFSIQLVRNKSNELVGFGEVMPNITEMIDRQLQEGGTYRLLSAATHGRIWANLALGLRSSKLGEEPIVEQQLTLDAALFLVVSSLDWIARPTWAYFTLNGWDLEQLAKNLEAVYDQAALKETTRFWRYASN